MSLKNDIRKTLDEFNLSLDNFKKSFFEDGEELVYLISKKHRAHSYTISEVYYHLTGRITAPFKTYKDKLKFENKVNECKFSIEKKYIALIAAHTRVKEFSKQHKSTNSMQKNSIVKIINETDKQIGSLLHIVSVDVNSEVNDFLRLKMEVSEICKFVSEKISICLHMIYSDQDFVRKLDYSKISKITEEKMLPGDIILFDEYKYYKNSYPRRRIVHYIGSTILHSAIFLKTDAHKNHLLFQAGGDNRMKSYIGTFNRDSGIRYIILRSRKKMSKENHNKMMSIISSNINRKFSILKLYGIALNYGLADFYSNWFPKITHGRNILATKGIVCSELISLIYRRYGLNIGNYTDSAMVSPVDILNSFELDVVGYMEEDKK
jgi:signal peptidase I